MGSSIVEDEWDKWDKDTGVLHISMDAPVDQRWINRGKTLDQDTNVETITQLG
jgi:hypothetical protein